MPVLSNVIAFLATTDAARSRAFFETVLRLTLVPDDAFALVFDIGGTELRVQKVAAFTPQGFTALGWSVADIDATLHDLAARGVQALRFVGMEQDGLGIWTAPGGARIAWFKDPDGNVLSLTAR